MNRVLQHCASMARQGSILLSLIFAVFFQSLQAQTVTPWLTTGDGSAKLAQQSAVSFGANSGSSTTITVNEGSTFQTMDGFGYTLTEGSAEVINSLASSQQNALLNEIFGSSGIGISMIRISIAASDLSSSNYSYKESSSTPFSLNGPDQTYLIPIIKKILAINPSIKILATPWSAPRWMKTNGSWVGGSLKTVNYSDYATYFVDYLNAMNAQGISIWGITPQNEPENPNNNPSMSMNANEELTFINNNLGPAVRGAGYNALKIIGFDHNCNNTSYPTTVANGSSYVDGSAFHLYEGDISALTTVHNNTGKNVYFTEQYTSSGGNFGGDLSWHTQNITIGSANNWAKAVFEWNLANNSSFGPYTQGGCTTCLGAITINNSTTYTRNVAYYIIAHLSKFVKPNAVRIASTSNNGTLYNTAFKNPDGSKVLVVLNTGGASTFRVVWNNQSFTFTLGQGNVATFNWGSGTTATPPATPANLTAASGNAQVTLSWSAASGAATYTIKRAAVSGGPYTNVATGITSTNYINTGLSNGTTYYYVVSAVNSAGSSSNSNQAGATPAVVTINAFSTIEAESFATMNGVQTETCSEGGSDVGYADSNDFIAFNNVDFGAGAASVDMRIASAATFTGTAQLRLGSTTGTLIGTVSFGNTGGWQTWTTRNVAVSGASGIKNLYVVFQGGNGIGNLNWLKFAASSTIQIPAAPTNVSATAGNGQVSLAWAASAGATSYAVKRSGTSGGSYTTIASGITATTYTNTGLSNGTTYYYVISASNSAGQSGNSSQVSATPAAATQTIANGIYKVTLKSNLRSLDVTDVSTANGARIQQWDYTGGTNQQWNIESLGSGLYKITSVLSSKALDVVDVSTANGAQIQQWDYSGGANQKWKIEDQGAGYFKITASHSNKVLNSPADANGTKVTQTNWTNTDNQKWKLELLQAGSARMATTDVAANETEEMSVEVYPNPGKNNRVTVKLNGVTEKAHLAVGDTSGRIIWSQHIDSGVNGIEIENLKPGFYILQVVTKNKRMSSKIIIE